MRLIHNQLPRRRCPCGITIEKKLPAQNQQPNPQRKTQRPSRNARTEHGSRNGSGDAACNQVNQQIRIRRLRKPMRAAADERNNKAECNIRPHHLRRQQRRQAQQRRRCPALLLPLKKIPPLLPPETSATTAAELRSRGFAFCLMGRKLTKICQAAVVTRIVPSSAFNRFCDPVLARCFRNSDPKITPGTPPSNINPSVRQATLRRAICAGTRINFTAVANIKPMPTATGAGTPRNKIRTGTVTVPAPTPVSAINSAMKNPNEILHVEASLFPCGR